MSRHANDFHATSLRGAARRAALLAGASLVALTLAAPEAGAGGLRDRNANASAATAAAAAAQAGSQAAAVAAAQAMSRVNTSLRAMRDAQAAARAAAAGAASVVPNGLAPGGLVVAPGATPTATNFGSGLWQGAKLPEQRSVANGRTQVEVKQTDQKAILTWQNFNVGRETDLYFNQTAGGADVTNWIALNRVLDPGASPSRILGTIKAEGQVYIINRNGIIFGGTSQVNVGSLVASSLALSNQQFNWGINEPRTITGGLGGGTNGIPMPQFGYLGQQEPNSALLTSDPGQVPGAVIGAPPGEVRAEAGAVIEMARGGKAMLFAPHVTNAGWISAPDGQVIMAAGEQVYLATSLNNPQIGVYGVRGLDVAVSAPMRWMYSLSQLNGALGREQIFDTITPDVGTVILPEMFARAEAVGYRVVNDGVVQAERGNITVMARDIVQKGGLLASTALNNRDGSIRLRAWDQGMTCYSSSFCEGVVFRYLSTGTVTLKPDSVTAVLPDLSDASEIELSSLPTRYMPGRVEVRGKLIDVESRANIVVPAGTISLVASTDTQAGDEPFTGEAKRDGSRIYVGEGAYLSVAGLKDVLVPMERNVVQAELRINELRDSPLQLNGSLRGRTIHVDVRNSGVFTDGPMAGVNWLTDDEGKFIPGAWVGTPLADVSAWIGVGKTTLAELSTRVGIEVHDASVPGQTARLGGSIIIKSAGSVITRPGSLIDVSGGSVRYQDGWVSTTKLLGADGRVYDIGQATPDRIYVGIAGEFTREHARWGMTEIWTSALRRGRRFEPGYTEGRNAGVVQLYAGEGVVLEGDYWGGTVVGERQAATGKAAAAGTLQFGDNSDDAKQWLLGNLIISDKPVGLPTDFTAGTPLDSSWYAGGLLPDGSEIPDSFKLRTTHLDADILRKAGFGKVDIHVTANVTVTEGTVLDLAPGSSFSVNANTFDIHAQDFRIDGTIRAPGGTVRFSNAENVFFGPRGTIDLSGQWVNEVTGGRATMPPVVKGGSVQVANARFEPGAVLDVSGGGWYRLQGSSVKLQVGDAGEITLLSTGADALLNADLRGYAAGSGGSLVIETDGSLQLGGGAPTAPDTVRLPETLFAERGFRSVRINTSGVITVSEGVTVSQVPVSVDLTGVDMSRVPSGTPMTRMGRLAVLPLSERVNLKPTSLDLTARAITVGAGAALETDVRGALALTLGPQTGGTPGSIEIAGRLEALAGTIGLSGSVTIAATGAIVATGVPIIEADGRGMRSGRVLGGGSVSLAGEVTIAAGALIDVSGSRADIDVAQGNAFGRRPFAPFMLASDGGRISVTGQSLSEGTWLGHAGGDGARGGSIALSSSTDAPIIVSETATAQSGLVVRPSVLQSGGFADLGLSSGEAIRFEGVDLSLAGSIALAGPLVNGNGTDSRLSAPYIVLSLGEASSGANAGTLTLSASLIDIAQSGIRGFERTVLEAADIRLIGLAAVLDNRGTLILRAGQVYPAGFGTIRASEKIVVEQRGAAGPALSAGGVLTLEAPVIEQGGTLKAPFGQIVLKASDRLTLGAGSITSVSGDGLILPYGNLTNNEYWTVAGADGQPPNITALPEKRITLEAPSVTLASGSVVDIRGGGDLYAWEHVPGPGGSHDVLTRPGMYAVLPAFNNAAVTDTSIRAGDRVWLAGGNGLAAGWYTLLPARYALLPGAYAVQMVGGPQSAAGPKTATLADGSMIMGGYRANAHDGSADRQPSSWRVMSGNVVRRYSEYNEAFANTFFASDAFKLTHYRQTGEEIVTPRLPMDGGSVVFKATQDLILNGQLRSQAAAGGRGGLVDIAAEKIAILGAGQNSGALRAAGYLIIDSANLSGFGAGSLLVGGTRSGDTQGLRVDVMADAIVVRNGAGSALSGSEIILAASEAIEVGVGSVIAAQGAAPSSAGDLVIAPQVALVINKNNTPNNPDDDFVETPERDWGALIRVSNGEAVRVLRRSVDTTVGGDVTIGTGAVLEGGQALLIDATRNTTVAAGARLSGAALSLASGRIGFGGGSGLVLDAAALAGLSSTRHLTLRSYSTIDLHNAVDLTGLTAVTFDAAALVGYGLNHIAVTGNRLALENTVGDFIEPVGAGHGSLSLIADELAFGTGAKALRGFDTVALTGTTRIVGEGEGSLDAGAASVTLSSAIMTGRGAAAQSLTTSGAITVTHGSAAAPTRDEASLGGRWSLTGRSITFGGRIDALGGTVELTATAGDVALTDGSLIDVGGFGKRFFDAAEYADAGRIALTAAGGAVRLGSGAVLDLAAHPDGGGAGTLAITSDGNGVALDGAIRAQAASGLKGASFSLDVARLSNFSGLNQRLSEAGFSKSRAFRVRTGDVIVDGTTTTETFLLAADQGHVTVAGTVDARARYGGEIAIYSGNGMTVLNTAVLRAGATDTVDDLGSGRVTLGITGGALAVQGGLIDVSGGEGGRVTLRAPLIEQPGADRVNVSFAGSITGAREIVLEGYKRFDLADLAANPNFVGVTINSNGQAELDLAATAAGKINVLASYGSGTLVEFVQDFDISATYGALGGLSGQAHFHARPGMELNYAGDIVLKSNWNLGAGIVDEAGARAAGVMGFDPVLNRYYVVVGRQGELLAHHTTMVYRTGGSIFGEPGALAIRAGGDLVLEGSVTDGFFQFADPLDAEYLAKANSTTANYDLLLNGGFNNGGGTTDLTRWSEYSNYSSAPTRYLGLGFGRRASDIVMNSSLVQILASSLHVPYSAEANSPAARGTLPGGAGDALRYAELFPAVVAPGGATVVPASWSYALVAGAVPSTQTADPTRRMAGAAGNIVFKEQASFTYTANPTYGTGQVFIDLNPSFSLTADPPTSPRETLADWLDTILDDPTFTGVSEDSAAVISMGPPNADPETNMPSNPARSVMQQLWTAFAAEHGLEQNSDDAAKGYAIIDGSSTLGYGIIMPVATLRQFYSEKIIPNVDAIRASYPLPGTLPMPATVQRSAQPTTVVRTGTGDIRIGANGSIRLDGGAAVYTAGRRDLAVYNDFTTGSPTAVYATGGGHVSIVAGGTIEAALSANRFDRQHYEEWLKRQGNVDESNLFGPFRNTLIGIQPAEQSAWWIDFANFQRGIGALGGGNLDVSAGGDLANLTVALTTNGRVRGGRTADEQKLLEMRNGGAMSVGAGGTIRAGYYYVGRGNATIEAGAFAVGREVRVTDGIGRTTVHPIAPILSLGDATLRAVTAGDLLVQTVLDPLLVRKGTQYEGAYMNGYTDRTALSLVSTGGDTILVGQTSYLSKDSAPENSFGGQGLNVFAGNLYPSQTRITALNGSVINRGGLTVQPGVSPELRILAKDDVLPGSIIMSRAALASIPSPFSPLGGTGSISPPPAPVPDRLPNADDHEPSRVYSLGGSILRGTITTNEQTWIRAGRDIRDIYYELRNIHPTDVSLLEAGNDIIGGPYQNPNLGIINPSIGVVRIEGPGALVVSAGRDVYSPALRLYSAGNRSYDELTNRPFLGSEIRGLPEQGATITVMAGLKGKQPSYDAFVAAYLDPANVAAMPNYLKTTLDDGSVVPLYFTDAFEVRPRTGQTHHVRRGLVSFVAEMTGETLAPMGAWAKFQTLPKFTRERFLRRVYMQELRDAGNDQLEPGENGLPRNGGYNRGYAAVETLFPGQDWKGDVSIGNAFFRTMAGGDIEVLTPGGGLQVAALGATVPAGYGLVTLGYGNIDIFARDHVTVNRSRILTFAGGDEIIWSTLGDIDAGRGAKTARVASAPEIRTDVDAVTQVLEKADISGSGIGTIIGFTGVTEGDVHLIAPQGTVNAGDAGVRVSGNLTVAARFVLNVDNFAVGGEVKGVPKPQATVAPLTVETKDKAAADAVRDATVQATPSARPSVIIVEILGYGGGDGGSGDEEEERKRARGQRSYNHGSPYQVLGVGPMTDEQLAALAAEKRTRNGQ